MIRGGVLVLRLSLCGPMRGYCGWPSQGSCLFKLLTRESVLDPGALNVAVLAGRSRAAEHVGVATVRARSLDDLRVHCEVQQRIAAVLAVERRISELFLLAPCNQTLRQLPFKSGNRRALEGGLQLLDMIALETSTNPVTNWRMMSKYIGQ